MLGLGAFTAVARVQSLVGELDPASRTVQPEKKKEWTERGRLGPHNTLFATLL